MHIKDKQKYKNKNIQTNKNKVKHNTKEVKQKSIAIIK